MSTHSAECSPHTCQEVETSRRAPSTKAACGRTLIRKTSLLRKIEPIARRSSFANRIIYNSLILQMLVLRTRERRNDPEIVIGKPRIASRDPKLGSISSLRCQKSRTRVPEDATREVMFRGRNIGGLDLQFHLVEPDGIEPTTSCLQSTRSPS